MIRNRVGKRAQSFVLVRVISWIVRCLGKKRSTKSHEMLPGIGGKQFIIRTSEALRLRLRLVLNQRPHVVAFQFLSSRKEFQLNYED